jgi:pyridoxamine 5'-phosphate oxidase
MQLADLREDYGRFSLRETDVDPDPFRQFAAWLAHAQERQLHEPHAVALATVAPDGQPSVRMVLLRGFDQRGFLFFTNYESRKGRELDANPRAALLFFWAPLERQVRIEGTVERATAEESDAYFRSRPFGSRLSAAASPQSQVIPDRAGLEVRVRELEAAHPDQQIPRPPFWGGYRVVPAAFEFWQGGPSRLHDRLRYRLADGRWLLERLAP